MKVVLLQDIPKLGFAGDIIKVTEGYAKNFLFPRKLAVEINATNEAYYLTKVKTIEDRKAAIESKTSMLAEKIKSLKLAIKKPGHDGDKLYASISQGDVAQLLAQEGVAVTKSQVLFDKSIKTAGIYDVTIKLSSKLLPTCKLKVVVEKSAA